MRAVVLVLFALVACSRGTVPANDRIRFSHGPHLRAGQRCLDCHGAPADGGAPTVTAMPREAQCKTCHTRPDQQRCGFCHTEARAPRTWPRVDRELVFSHSSHVERQHGGCVQCHGASTDATHAASFEPEIPRMETCTGSCHAPEMRAMDCAKCHRSLSRYTPETLSMVRHAPGFARRHGVEARTSGALCSQCHEPNYCVRCHTVAPLVPLAGVEPTRVSLEFIHRGDFMARHATESRLDQSACVRCHAVDTCDGCHRSRGVGGSVAPGSVHGPGWLDPFSPRGHARAARRDLLTCVGCHESDATRVCVPCHRVGAAAGNPHPPGFSAGLDAQRHAVCLACHGAAP